MQNSLVPLMIDYHFVGSPFENYWGMIKTLEVEVETWGLIHVF